MNLQKEIEILRESLNNMLLNEQNLCKDEIIKASQQLDKFIYKYYLKS
jgi:hypothetical protein